AAAAGLGGNSAFFQLAEGNGRSMLAVTPECTPPACPGEFSATNTGAIYDGNSVGPTNTEILTIPRIDGPTPPNIPSTDDATNYENQANKMSEDAQKCQDADTLYAPQERQINGRMTDLSNQFKAADCGGGGCSKSKARHCQALGDQLKATCSQYMNVNCEHMHACPLTASQSCSSECTQTGQHATATTTNTGDGTDATSVPQ
ncbi:MAG: hypothetical protein KGL74_11950, partial [Elusimicrobia bacterium]|nr:hypothetical protein [Elusimicrobiota bacterium]